MLLVNTKRRHPAAAADGGHALSDAPAVLGISHVERRELLVSGERSDRAAVGQSQREPVAPMAAQDTTD